MEDAEDTTGGATGPSGKDRDLLRNRTKSSVLGGHDGMNKVLVETMTVQEQIAFSWIAKVILIKTMARRLYRVV